ncbi:hypothetical protein EAO75_07500 [Streptomyces sp. uw30]|uniref:hypothetical protein n=1 Tax=Streptomyces sp. uw30 TaxID=1828179 RepID=UPI0011CD912C|nr:hypothetical protein [Streptomyces sp. uw30]TXS53954.1 hypothetical protein EAO75_07500 [Streptomyces sp. uw30]
MPRWVVVVQSGSGEQYRCEEAARFEGTLEQARARLYEIACTHKHRGGLRQQRREVFRVGAGDAYYAHVEGLMSTHRVLFQLAEQVWSTDPEPNPWQ